MSVLTDAVVHADAIIAAAKAAIDAETKLTQNLDTGAPGLVMDRPACNIVDRIIFEINKAAKQEDYSDVGGG